MSYENKFTCVDKEKLCEVICPNDSCQHFFLQNLLTSPKENSYQFDCVKCGSRWMGLRKTVKEKGGVQK